MNDKSEKAEISDKSQLLSCNTSACRKTAEIWLHSKGQVERDAIAIFERTQQKSHTDSHTDSNNGDGKRLQVVEFK